MKINTKNSWVLVTEMFKSKPNSSWSSYLPTLESRDFKGLVWVFPCQTCTHNKCACRRLWNSTIMILFLYTSVFLTVKFQSVFGKNGLLCFPVDYKILWVTAVQCAFLLSPLSLAFSLVFDPAPVKGFLTWMLYSQFFHTIWDFNLRFVTAISRLLVWSLADECDVISV